MALLYMSVLTVLKTLFKKKKKKPIKDSFVQHLFLAFLRNFLSYFYYFLILFL